MRVYLNMRVYLFFVFTICFLIGCILRFVFHEIFRFRRNLIAPEFVSEKRNLIAGNLFDFRNELNSYATRDFGENTNSNYRIERSSDILRRFNWSEECSTSRCFNFSRCNGKPFKVHIYPSTELELQLTTSELPSASAYSKILSSIVRSEYYTSDPSRACLFVVAFDTLDRDSLSVDYVKNLRSKFASLATSLWNDGENHLIFNLYQGTWPNYDVTDLGIETGKAILVKASFSVLHFRSNFDISLPLFHRVLPSTTEDDDGLFKPVVSSDSYASGSSRKRYLFSFKGKRYVHGIGSETRNSLYHLHDGGLESVVVTTCRHGKNWHQAKDERCDQDNDAYDRWGSYEWLLSRSDFSLVPRGRRLGSYRFLESLQYGCVPMILANEWELPFSEIVTWSEATVTADERLLSLVPDNLREISTAKTFVLRQKAKMMWQKFFSSVDRIVATTLEIIKRRLKPWEESSLDKETFEAPLKPTKVSASFHAYVILGAKRNAVATRRLLESISSSNFCSKITIVCFDCAVPKIDRRCPISVMREADGILPELPTWENQEENWDGIFWIDTSISFIQLSTDEIDFASQVWRWFPDRLVGFFARHSQSDGTLSSRLRNDFTSLTSGAIVFHKRYTDELNSKLTLLRNNRRLPCFDRLLNEVIKKRPIKLTARYHAGKFSSDTVNDEDCLGIGRNTSSQRMKSSKIRFDPLLYKDPVSNLRKKYRQMEIL